MTLNRPVPGGRRIVVLLFFFMFINFADKAIIGLAAVPIMRDLQLTPSQFGLVGSSFFLLFSASSVVVGFLCNHIQTRWLLFVMSLIWAAAQFPMAGNAGFATLVACRVLLGAGEGPAFPVAVHAAYKWYPNQFRTLPTAVISQGAGVGIVLGLPILNLIIVYANWHWAFAALGIAGLLWCLAWLIWGEEGTLEQDPDQAIATRVPYLRLLLNPSIIAVVCAGFSAYWALSLSLSWGGAYFIQGLGFRQDAAGPLTAAAGGLSVIITLCLGWFSERMMMRGVRSRISRGLLGGAAVCAGGLSLLLLPLAQEAWLRVLLVLLGLALPSIIYAIMHAVVGEIAPAAQRGAVLAIANATGTSGGLIAPFVMGSIVERASSPIEGFHAGFVLCGLIMLTGGLIGALFIRPDGQAKRLTEDRSSGVVMAET